MMTRTAFAVLVALVAMQRAAELAHSERHARGLLRRGGVEHAPAQMRWMALLHGGWLVAMPLEVFVLGRPFVAPLAIAALSLFGAGQVLRYLAIRRLGPRWTARIVTVPGWPAVTEGIFRHLRHPNYLGVVLEVAALPLVHGAWFTALVATVLNALLLRRRIRAEEAALAADNDYEAAFGHRSAIDQPLRRDRLSAP